MIDLLSSDLEAAFEAALSESNDIAARRSHIDKHEHSCSCPMCDMAVILNRTGGIMKETMLYMLAQEEGIDKLETFTTFVSLLVVAAYRCGANSMLRIKEE